MPVAERTGRRRIATATSVEPAVIIDDDGEPYRLWEVDGVMRRFSLREIPINERTIYWNPIHGAGAPMWWRTQDINEYGFQPVMQREIWIDGKFAPRNEWEVYMTEDYLRTWVPGGDPERWQGYNHPENEPGEPPHFWRCGCSWTCGNWHAFKAHQTYLRHTQSVSE